MIFIWAIHALSAFAQQCLQISSDSICGNELAGYSIPMPSKDLDALLMDKVANIPKLTADLEQTGCSSSIASQVEKLRFQLTFQCLLAVNGAISNGCAPSGKKLVVHTSICKYGQSSLSDIYSNQCSSNQSMNATLSAINQICLNNVTTDASIAYVATKDATYCGFAESVAFKMCSSTPYSLEKCCTEYLKNITTKTTILVVCIVSGVVILLCIGVFVYLKYFKTGNSHSMWFNKHKDKFEPLSKKTDRKLPVYQPNIAFIANTTDASVNVTLKSELNPTVPPSTAMPNTFNPPSTPLPNTFNPLSGEKLRVIHNFKSTLDDELTIQKGTFIHLIRKFDDGWCLGYDPISHHQGVFPDLCVEEYDESSSVLTEKVSQESFKGVKVRVSSMIAIDIINGSRPKVPFNHYISQLEQQECSPQNFNGK